ncbi:hypothetical protein [Streptomyces murinus]|uniref:hypothetical protein n=1 Tax=Streptomyces murinus TaxID=33900 RepID=UPI0018F6AA54|nr:hypothetical protein [Streptomyces murinus]
MGCSCAKKRQQYEVVADGGKGKVLYSSPSKPTSEAVSRRYAGSIVREKAKEEAPVTKEKTAPQ